MAINVGILEATLRLKDEMSAALNLSAGAIGKHNKAVTDLGHSLLPLSAAIGGVGILAMKMSTDFNASMAEVATLIPKATKQLEEFKKGIQDMSGDVGKTTKDLAAGMYQVISAFGADNTSDTLDRLKISADAAEAGVTTTLDAINLLSAVTKGYGDISQEAMKKASDLAFMTVKLGQTNFPQLAGSMRPIIPIAAALAVSQEELFASMSTLSGVTGSADQVATQLKAMMNALLTPTEAMSSAMRTLGVTSVDAMIKQYGMVGSVQALIGATNGSKEAIAQLFPSVRALPAVFALTGGQVETFKVKLKQMSEASGATKEALNEIKNGVNKTGHEFEELKLRGTVAMQRLGDSLNSLKLVLLAVFDKSIVALEKGVKAFSELPPAAQNTIIALATLTAVAGPALIAIGRIARGLEALKVATAVGKGGLSEISTALRLIPGVGTAGTVLGWTAAFVAVAAASYAGTQALTAYGDKLWKINRVPVNVSFMDGIRELPKLLGWVGERLKTMPTLVRWAFEYNPISLWLKGLASVLSLIQNISDKLAMGIFGPKKTAEENAIFPPGELKRIQEVHDKMVALRKEREKAAQASGGGAAAKPVLAGEALKEYNKVQAYLKGIGDVGKLTQEKLNAAVAELTQFGERGRIAGEAITEQWNASHEAAETVKRDAASWAKDYLDAQNRVAAAQVQMIGLTDQYGGALAREIASIEAEARATILEIDQSEKSREHKNALIGLAIEEANVKIRVAQVTNEVTQALERETESAKQAEEAQRALEQSLSAFGPGPKELQLQFNSLQQSVMDLGGISNMTSTQLGSYVSQLRAIEDQGRATEEVDQELMSATVAFRASGAGVVTSLVQEARATMDANASLLYLKDSKDEIIKKLELEGLTTDEATAAYQRMIDKMKEASGQSLGFKGAMTAALVSLPNTVLGALQGGGSVTKAVGGLFGGALGTGIMGDTTKGITKTLSASFLGKSLGGALGSAIPGLGTMLGGLVGGKIGGLVTGIFGGGEGKKVNKARDEFLKGFDTSQFKTLGAGTDALRKKAAEAGVAAKDLDALFKAKNLKDYEAAVEKLNEALATGEARKAFIDAKGGLDDLKRTAKDAGVTLDKLFNAKSQADVDAYTKKFDELLSKQQELKDIAKQAIGKMAENLQLGVDTSTLKRKDLGAQLTAGEISQEDYDKAIKEIKPTGIKLITPEDARSQATIAMLSFDRVVKEQGLLAAADAFKPVAEALRANIAEVGGDISSAEQMLGPMFSQIALASNDAFRGAVEGAQGFAGILEGFRADQMPLTIDQLGAFGQQAQSAFAQAMSGGATTQQALTGIAPLLAQLQGASSQYGLKLDANTQSLLDQAKAAGIAFPVDPIDKLVASINALVEALGGVPAAFDPIKAAATSATTAIAGTATSAAMSVSAQMQQAAAAASAAGNNYAAQGISQAMTSVPQIPVLGEGGWITQPTLAWVGEKGMPELVGEPDTLRSFFSMEGTGGDGKDQRYTEELINRMEKMVKLQEMGLEQGPPDVYLDNDKVSARVGTNLKRNVGDLQSTFKDVFPVLR